MPLEEVRNEKFFKEDQHTKRRRKRTSKHKETEDDLDSSDSLLKHAVSSTRIPVVEYIANSTNVNHKIYRDLLINRRNGERVGSLNPYRE
jgi:hypothetical protein